MAVVTGNSLLQNLSGTIGGDFVFKKYADKTVLSVKPARKRRRKKSELQQHSLDRFKAATRYARAILLDPVKCEKYKKLAKKLNKHSAYNLAISEYMLSIRIEKKETVRSKTDQRQRVTLTATKKNINVKNVTAEIFIANCETSVTVRAKRVSNSDWVLNFSEPPQNDAMLKVTATDDLNLTTIKYLHL